MGYNSDEDIKITVTKSDIIWIDLPIPDGRSIKIVNNSNKKIIIGGNKETLESGKEIYIDN